jgi:UrcA family protein
MKFVSLAVSAAICATAITVPAIAADSLSQKAEAAFNRVKTTDIDLATKEGQAELDERMEKAMRRVCRKDNRGQIVSASKERDCVDGIRGELTVELARQGKTEQGG